MDPSLWTTFHQARDALLKALREVPSVNDIHVTPPPTRAIPPIPLIQAISEAEHEIETAQNELSSVRSYLAHNRAIVTNWSSSLAMLPYELIQEIVSYAVVTPGQQREIMRLSRVSKRRREAVLAMPWLFATANWNAWSYPLIELWCQRAGTHSLNISLGDRAIRQLWSERDSKLMSLLHSCAPRWGELEIRFEGFRLKWEGVAEAVQRLLQGSTPSLHHLTLFTAKRENETTLSVMLDCPPPLNVSLSGVWVFFGACSTSVTDLALQLSHLDSLSRVVDVLNNCPLIQRLKLDLEHYSEGLVDFRHTRQTMLPSLVHLELHNIQTKFVTDIGKILSRFRIPVLNSITVAPVASAELNDKKLLPLLIKCYSDVFCSFLQLFILQERTIPNAQNISVLNYCSGELDPPICHLKCLGMEPTIFTRLTELHLPYKPSIYCIDSNRYSRLGQVIQGLVHFREGSITHLTAPPFDKNIMESLRSRVPHLKVCHSSFHWLHVERSSS